VIFSTTEFISASVIIGGCEVVCVGGISMVGEEGMAGSWVGSGWAPAPVYISVCARFAIEANRYTRGIFGNLGGG
jgi:hypothetical protein